MTVAISAENYQKKFYFLLTVNKDCDIAFQPLSQSPW